MIERDFVKQNKKEFQIEEFVSDKLKNVGKSHIKMQRTPLGEKIIIFTSRPGLVVGREGKTIKQLTRDLKKKFKLENPQIEINEVENPNIDARIIAEGIASSLERFGIKRFKGIGHKSLSDVMGAGALGVEILISGKIPGSRAKKWRFYQGYLKKCGDISITGVDKAYVTARLKIGVIGIQVRIMPSTTKLPDNIQLLSEKEEIIEEVEEEKETKDEETDDKKETKKDEDKKKEEKIDDKKETEEEKPVKKETKKQK